MSIIITNEDNMQLMARYPDKYFDLVIDDPMYKMPDNYLVPGSGVSTKGIKRGFNKEAKELAKQPIVGWDYYNELCRVSKNQIIWGINYFEFAGAVPGRIFWDKKNDGSTFSNGELASCSMFLGVRIFRYMWNGMLQEKMGDNKEIKIHPFQKPVALYKWILEKYCKPGDKILDCHLGSGSHAIACHDYGYDLTACELDTGHFNNAMKRIEQHTSQQKLFVI